MAGAHAAPIVAPWIHSDGSATRVIAMTPFTVFGARLVATVALAAAALPAHATTCAAGVYRAGCVGPNGAVATRRPVAPAPAVRCAAGAYHAGCVGPNGAVVTNRHPHCYWRNGVKVCT
jgi:hypothetical protein